MHCPKCETIIDKLPHSLSRWKHYECVKCKAKLNRKSMIPHMIGIMVTVIIGMGIIGLIIWFLLIYNWIDRKYTVLIEMPEK